jgi:putative ABC transport system permease protein
MTMEHVISGSKLNGRVSQALITIIACIALALAAVGLYAVTAHAVAQRTHEIGLRMALGARSSQVMTLVLKQATRQLAFGLIMGVLGTATWQWSLGDSTQRYRMTDPIVLMMVAVLIIAVGFVACWWPARRATSVDAVLALRCD